MTKSGDFVGKEVNEIIHQIHHRSAGRIQQCRIMMQQLADNAKQFPLIKVVHQ